MAILKIERNRKVVRLYPLEPLYFCAYCDESISKGSLCKKCLNKKQTSGILALYKLLKKRVGNVSKHATVL